MPVLRGVSQVSDASFDPDDYDDNDDEAVDDGTPSLRIYVAGSSAEMARAEKWMARLRQAGIDVTSSWPDVIRKVGEANPMHVSRNQRAKWAATDLAEIEHSNVFWLLLPEGQPSVGAYTELGFATMLALDAVSARRAGVPGAFFKLVCSGVETSIFTAVADHFPSDNDAFGFLVSLQREFEHNFFVEMERLRALIPIPSSSPEAALQRQLDNIFKLK